MAAIGFVVGVGAAGKNVGVGAADMDMGVALGVAAVLLPCDEPCGVVVALGAGGCVSELPCCAAVAIPLG